ncbi:MAG: twin-arginine translocation signal domain-containing protein [Gammaproteobacteria bacterium]|nr:twin-arginine translocation signal domain-containing protein [Gammaproteobacteria bacterium]
MSKDKSGKNYPETKDEPGTSRREFLKTSALTATGLTVGLSSLNASVFANMQAGLWVEYSG